jgi:hypothetical protein
MKNQQEFLQEIIDLASQNPTLPIHFCAASDELDDTSRWTMHKITLVEICPWWELNERIYTDMDEIRETMEDNISDNFTDSADLAATIETWIATAVTQAICVYTSAG